MSEIIYTINQGKAIEILNHLNACDDAFIPPLSQRLELLTYTEKLISNATNFEAWNDQKQLIGLISIYMNDVNLKAAYITSVSVCQEYKGKGIARRLMAECLKETKQRGFAQIKLEVNELSTLAINLYTAFGFSIYEINKEIITMKLKLKSDDKE